MNFQVELVQESPVDSLCDLVQAFGKRVACCSLRQVGCQGTWEYLLSVAFTHVTKFEDQINRRVLIFIGFIAGIFLKSSALMELNGFYLQILT